MPAPTSVIRPARPVIPVPDQDLYVYTHTCGPLLQHELLQATSMLSPAAYERAASGGLTLQRTKSLLQRGGVINASPTIRLARMLTADPHGYDIFALSGINLADTLRQQIPYLTSLSTGLLPRLLRIRKAMAIMQKHKQHFVGSRSQLLVRREHDHLYVGVIDSIFSGREDTLIGGGEMQRRAIEALFRDFAHVSCRVVKAQPRRLRLNEAWFEIVRTNS